MVSCAGSRVPESGGLRRLEQTVPAITIVTVLLAVCPWASSPFMGPKWVAMLAGALASLLVLIPRPAVLGPIVLAAAANLAVASGLLPGVSAPWWTLTGPLLIVALSLQRPALPSGAIATAAAIVSAVVALQAAGLDPFAWLAPDAGGGRLRLYGTLGNPDFVASVLGVTLPLTTSTALDAPAPRRSFLVSGGLQLLALVLLRSFATTLSLGAAALVVLVRMPRSSPRRSLLSLGLATAVLVVSIPLAGRSLSTAMQGRGYLVSVAAPHVADAPWLGHGPGAVVRSWPVWELEFWRARCGQDAACVAADPRARFTGVQDHVHDDWLERALESGVPGLAALLALLGTVLAAALRSRTPEGVAIAAAVASLSARATVDFPLERPADLSLLALLAGAAARLSCIDSSTPPAAVRKTPLPEGGAR